MPAANSRSAAAGAARRGAQPPSAAAGAGGLLGVLRQLVLIRGEADIESAVARIAG